MKFIHLSDLHIGKKVKNYSMVENQRDVLNQILNIIDDEKPDGILIAGDIYDRDTPSAEAISMLDNFLVSLSQKNAEVFVISGNHDSAAQIAFASKLIEKTGIHMSPVYNGEIKPFTMKDEYGEVEIYMLPFLKPMHIRRVYGEETITNYTDAIKVAVDHMNIDESKRNIILSHQFVTGAGRCDSEIQVGGLDNVDAEAYEVFDYVALGHIHSPQTIKKGKIRYCGTPLKYSFSEADQKKSVTIVEIKEKGNVEITTRELTCIKDFIRIRGTFEEIAGKYSDRNIEDYVEVTLTDEQDIPDVFRKLQLIFPNIMLLMYDNIRTRERRTETTAPIVKELSEFELFERLFELQNNQKFNAVQAEYIEKIIDEIKEEKA